MNPSIPTFPEALPGELWGVTSYFNPAGYGNKLENLERFAAGVRAQGLKLSVIELAFGDQPFRLPDTFADRIERRRSTSVLWQKERLLNIAIEQLPESCDKVAWVDGDLIFERPDWVKRTAELLEQYMVVQPFERCSWLRQGEFVAPDVPRGFGNHEGQSMHSMAYGMSEAIDRRDALNNYFEHGHVGFAWAARRSLIAKHGLYDAQILGNGDFVMGHSMYGDEDLWEGRNWQCTRLSPQILAHITRWGKRFYEDVQGSVAYAEGRVLHMWHGAQKNRQYDQRLEILREAEFDPESDLALDDQGCWVWATDKAALHQWASGYFHERREDSID